MPFYPDGVLEEVRNSVNIVSLISEYVALKKRGRNFVARCPFHTERTPSFNVNPEKQIFMCFGCSTGGDAFKFVMQVEHLTFPEAVRFLAERNGIRLPVSTEAAEAPTGRDLDALRAAMKEAADFYHAALLKSPEGRVALDYLRARGIQEAAIEQFQLGYSPGAGDALLHALTPKGHSRESLEECGLLKRSDDGRRHYDAFRGRVMFPIADLRGRIIAFGGRAMGDAQPKYLNSPETRLYNKSRNLFGLSVSREGIKKQSFAILVEGYLDCIVPHQFGVNNVVASLGTSLTPQQVSLLARYTGEVVVCYDPDSAGVAATQRSLDLFLEEDFRVRVLPLPVGQDPDAFIRAAGVEEYRSRVRHSVSYLDYLLERAVQSQGAVESPKKKVQVINTVLPYLAKLPNAVERSEYVFRFARRLQIEDSILLGEVRKAAQRKRPGLPDSTVESLGTMKFAEKRLLQLLLGDKSLQLEVLPRCSVQDFEGLATEKIFEAILEKYRSDGACSFEDLHSLFAGREEQAYLAQMQMEEVPEGRSCDSAESCLNALRLKRLDVYRQQINSKIAEASERRDDEMVHRLIEQRIRLDLELVSLSRK